MNKILDVLLFPLTELVGWLIMRDLRRRDAYVAGLIKRLRER